MNLLIHSYSIQMAINSSSPSSSSSLGTEDKEASHHQQNNHQLNHTRLQSLPMENDSRRIYLTINLRRSHSCHSQPPPSGEERQVPNQLIVSLAPQLQRIFQYLFSITSLFQFLSDRRQGFPRNCAVRAPRGPSQHREEPQQIPVPVPCAPCLLPVCLSALSSTFIHIASYTMDPEDNTYHCFKASGQQFEVSSPSLR
jgi:hypothetical protein